MPAQKRPLDESSSTKNAKKFRTNDNMKSLPTEEVDFPRGGGTTFTPLEVKTIRAEAVNEANAELFEDIQPDAQKSKKRKRKTEVQASHTAEGKDRLRIEHLNYKRINVGMKILGQVIAILPLALIISLPNQLFAHIPITNISVQFTEFLDSLESQDFETNLEEDGGEGEEDRQPKLRVPELSDMFKVGQYVRAIVSAVHPPGASDASDIGRSRDEASRASKRVELCLIPERVNVGVQKSDLKSGFTLTAAVKSQEDHGYILDFGIPDISGFLPFNDRKDEDTKLHVGVLLDVTVTKVSGNGRTCTVSADQATFTSSYLSEISSASSILPGTLVQALVTASHSTGVNLLVLGYFEGTIDPLHLPNEGSSYKIGKKIKARILYHYSSSSPPKFALALTEHVVNLRVRQSRDKDEEIKKTTDIQDAYPVGTLLEAVKVLRIEPERGLIVEVELGLEGFVHISHASDNHIPSLLTNGLWKSGSLHQARVTGHFALDGLLQISLKPSVIQQKYFQVTDVEVGEVIKGTVKKLTDSALFVSLSDGIDGVVWPNHYADITLKHPAKRFQVGSSVKCRVLVVDPDRKRISLTAKKSLLDSSLPIFSKIEDFEPGLVTHAVVFKVYEKCLLVEFYNNLKAVVPAKEISDSPQNQLPELFPVGRVVQVRMLALHNGRITASIRQVVNHDIVSDISSIEIGHTVEGAVSEIHKDNAVLTLQPSHIRALLSLKNLANHRGLTLPQLRTGLKVGENLKELVVMTRNAEKAFVIVANKPKPKSVPLLRRSAITMESVEVGQLVGGRVTRHTRHGALIKITTNIGGILHATDTSDCFEPDISLPGIDAIIKATIIGINKTKRQLTLSTRHSRMHPRPDQVIADREISGIEDIQVGETLRGFIKNIGEHGLFVTIARDVEARVQIRELFDEYIKDWKSQFHVNKLVKGRLLSVDISSKKIEMTLRSGDPLTRRESSGIFISDLKEGQKVEGVVKKIEDYGLFIQINESKINGLCHKSQLSDNVDANVTMALRGFREGDRVKAIILSIDMRRISLSLKPSYFTEEDLSEDINNDILTDDPQASNILDLVADASKAGSEHDNDDRSSREDDDDSMDVDIILDEAQTEYHPTQASSIPKFAAPSSLPLAGGFHWSGDVLSLNEYEEAGSSSDESNDAEKPSRKKRKKREIEQDLTSEMHTKTPESNADFERLLLGSPNSSYLWIQYMSFQLPLSELDKAREIARRGIQTINFREEKERLNVWIALLNLENVYGTEDSLQAVFKEAARANDSKTVHLRLASILDQAEKLEQVEEHYKRTCKKFGQSSKVWTLSGEYYLRRGNVEEARKLLPRSLQSLEKRKHLKTISRFAQLEYKYGDPERGKTLFEGIVDSHHKRWDMWSVYVDMEASQGNIQASRNIFDRVLAFKMTSHKAKSFFKKWFEFEKRIGDAEGTEMVKAKAIEWTQRASNVS